ncbi:hypothetical protein F5887DRAFT_966972 [Amanita rubescens]|nr:hypothetical protein F5887DRAFT_966972 [Amanita rubescens]
MDFCLFMPILIIFRSRQSRGAYDTILTPPLPTHACKSGRPAATNMYSPATPVSLMIHSLDPLPMLTAKLGVTVTSKFFTVTRYTSLPIRDSPVNVSFDQSSFTVVYLPGAPTGSEMYVPVCRGPVAGRILNLEKHRAKPRFYKP